MSKITLSTVSELQAFPSAAANINSNSDILEAAIDNTLSRDGTQPNSMGANLDMNSNRILNLPTPISNLEPARLIDLETLTGSGTITVNPVPTGGTTGQALVKNSNSNYDTGWGTIQGIPTGGTTNQVLAKNSGTNYDATWKSSGVPTGGTTGQVLSKSSGADYATTWTTPTAYVTGVASSVNDSIARFTDTSGKAIGDSTLQIDNVNTRLSKVGGGGIAIQGISPGVAVPAGYVGEQIINTVLVGAGVACVSGSAGQVWNTITLSNGIWLVTGNTGVYGNSGSTVFTHMHCGIGVNMTSIPSSPTLGTTALHITSNHPNGWMFPVNPQIIYVTTGTATVNACATTDFTGGTAVFYGQMQAVRIA